VLRTAVGPSNPTLAVEVRQGANGGLAALELGAAYLAAGTDRPAVLVTAADRFCLPGYDRWLTDPGTPRADGASALVLDRRGGFARLVATVSRAEPELEGMARGDDPFGVAPLVTRRPVRLDIPRDAFIARMGEGNVTRLLKAGYGAVLEQALEESGSALREIDWFVLPNLGRRLLDEHYVPLGIDLDRSTWPWGRRVGQMGPADQFAGLEHLLRSGRLRPGQRILLMGMGAGVVWSCACLEVLSTEPAGAAGDDPAGTP
jgi:3-oxoacyl-[acyl-carrier-protein] synthase-3